MKNELDRFFSEGKKYNLASSPTYEPAVARQYFELAAQGGHMEATLALALMLHQGVGGPKELPKAISLLARAYFRDNDHEAVDCLVEVMREEVDAGNVSMNDIGLSELADRLEEMDRVTRYVRREILQLVRPR